jgi:hypothetical protein
LRDGNGPLEALFEAAHDLAVQASARGGRGVEQTLAKLLRYPEEKAVPPSLP